jgi:iron complex outermembrane receptor protein
MLNKRNLFFALAFGLVFSTSSYLYADNPGEDVAPEVAEVAETQEEVVTEEVAETSAASTDSGSTASDSDTVELTKVSVTGSRIKRTDIEGPQPLVVITSADIAQGGFISVYEAVSSLAQNTGQTVMDGLGGGTNDATTNQLNLRDFGPGRTLVLVNGKRRANYPYPSGDGDAAFNWNRIPIGLVERIEILTAGASAIYGADAVAGVVNVILVDGTEDISVQLRGGVHHPFTNRASGESFNVEISGGGYFDNGSYVWGLELDSLNPLNGKDRPQFDEYGDEPVSFYQYGMWAGYWASSASFATSFLPQEMGASTTCEDLGMFEDNMANYGWAAFGRTERNAYCNLDAVKYRTVRNGSDRGSAYLAGSYTLENGIQLNADVHYWESEAENVYFPYFVQQAYDAPYIINNNGEILGAFGTDYTGGSIDPGVWDSYGFAYGFGQRFFAEKNWQGDYTEDTLSYTLTAASTFEFRDSIWDWELAYIKDEYNYLQGAEEVMNDSLDAWSCGGVIDYYPQLCTAGAYGYSVFNPDTYWGTYEMARSYGLWQYAYIEGESSSETIQFTTSGDIYTLPAGPVGFAFHYEDTSTDYLIDPGPQYDADNVWGNSTTEGGGERTRTSYALEFSIPVTATFNVYLATRNDDYDEISTQIGDRRTDQVTFSWKPTDNLLIRGGWGESFAAPSLPYIYKGESGSFGTPCDYYGRWLNTGETLDGLCTGYTQLNAQLVSQGNRNLRAEDGENYNFGIVLDVINTSKVKLDMTLDFVELELNNIVSATSSNGVLVDEMICRVQESGDTVQGFSYSAGYCADIYASVIRGAVWTPQGGGTAPDITPPEGGITSVEYGFINQAGTYYRGADFSMDARFITDNLGDFFLGLNIAYVDDEKRSDVEGDPFVSIMGQERRLRSRSYLSLSWTKGDWAAGISTSRIGSMNYRTSWAPDPTGGNKINPYFDVGSFVRYNISDGHYVGLSVSNLFDDIPEYNEDLGWPWFARYYYSPVGREVFLTYRYTF